jgi:hypothetical protein
MAPYWREYRRPIASQLYFAPGGCAIANTNTTIQFSVPFPQWFT